MAKKISQGEGTREEKADPDSVIQMYQMHIPNIPFSTSSLQDLLPSFWAYITQQMVFLLLHTPFLPLLWLQVARRHASSTERQPDERCNAP